MYFFAELKPNTQHLVEYQAKKNKNFVTQNAFFRFRAFLHAAETLTFFIFVVIENTLISGY